MGAVGFSEAFLPGAETFLFQRLFTEGLQIDDFVHARPSRGLISTVAFQPPMEEKRRTKLKQNAILADRRQA